MRRTRALAAAFASFALSACARPQLDIQREATLREPVWLALNNFTVLRVDPAGRDVALVWRGYDVRHGDAFHVPWHEIELSGGAETWLVTNRGAGNGALIVNGEVHAFRAPEQALRVRFGEGVSIVPGIPYEDATRIDGDL